MRIFIDGDGCPVAEITIKTGAEFGIETVFVCDTAHFVNRNDCICITVEKGSDSVDFYIINNACRGDIVVTQDYGLGAMCLGRDIFAINQNGFIYSVKNIDGLLLRRHIGREVRRSGGKSGRIKARSAEDDVRFKKSLKELIKKVISNTD